MAGDGDGFHPHVVEQQQDGFAAVEGAGGQLAARFGDHLRRRPVGREVRADPTAQDAGQQVFAGDLTKLRPQLEGEARILLSEGFRQRALADPADAADGGDGYRVRVGQRVIERCQFVGAPDEAIRRRDVVTRRAVGSGGAFVNFDFDAPNALKNFVCLFARCES